MTRLKKRLIGFWQKRIFYVTTGLLWLSGVVWLYFKYCWRSNDSLEFQIHPASTMSLKIHGAMAIFFLVIFGTLLNHVRVGWRQKHRRLSGLSLIIPCIILIMTGWVLYYVAEEHLRNLTSIIHSVLGILLPMIILFHVWTIIQRRSKMTNLKQY